MRTIFGIFDITCDYNARRRSHDLECTTEWQKPRGKKPRGFYTKTICQMAIVSENQRNPNGNIHKFNKSEISVKQLLSGGLLT